MLFKKLKIYTFKKIYDIILPIYIFLGGINVYSLKIKILSVLTALTLVIMFIPFPENLRVNAVSEITVNGTEIFANGNAIIIAKGPTSGKTFIYLDTNSNGVVDSGDIGKDLVTPPGDPISGYDLSGYTIYGGGYLQSSSSTKITMIGGNVAIIYGGGCQTSDTGDTNVTVSGGTINSIYGGGDCGNVRRNTNVTISGGTINNIYGGGWSSFVNGNTNVTITGGTVNFDVHGGGYEGDIIGDTYVTISGGTVCGYVLGGGDSGIVSGNTNVTITGGTVSDVCGGGISGYVTGTSLVKIGVDCSIIRYVSFRGCFNQSVGTGSHIEYEVAFYDVSGGTKYISKWITSGQKAVTPTAPAKSGYTFKGWYQDANCTKAWNFSTDTVTKATKLFAKWDQNAPPVTTPANKPTIVVAETPNSIPSPELIAANPVGEPFDKPVEVRLKDDSQTKEEISKAFESSGTKIEAGAAVFPLDISLYVKGTDTKVQPKEGAAVEITCPIPKELVADQDNLFVVCVIDGKLHILPVKKVVKNDIPCAVFTAAHFSPYAFVIDKDGKLATLAAGEPMYENSLPLS